MRRDRRAYGAWRNARERCLNPSHPLYKDYGGRGITFYENWLCFKTFLADMGHPPEEHFLDRWDNDAGYTPENCRWATPSESGFNRRSLVSQTGISGVRWREERGVFEATVTPSGKQIRLYYGPNFFEACCARKSWEAHNLFK